MIRTVLSRFYIDAVNYIANVDGTQTVTLTTGTLNTGSTVEELFDMNPNNQVSFDTSGHTTTDIKIAVSFPQSSYNFIAILNHNLATAGGTVAVLTAVNGVEVLNCTDNGDNTFFDSATDADGDSIFTFDIITSNGVVITFSPKTTWSATDLDIGCILVGQYYTVPHRANTGVSPNFKFKNKINESQGGRKFSNSIYSLGTRYRPFRKDDTYKVIGRLSYGLKFSMVDDTEIFPTDLSSVTGANATMLNQVINKTLGSHIPFVYTVDSTSSTAGDYLFARLAKPISMKEVAPRLYDVDMAIEEEM